LSSALCFRLNDANVIFERFDDEVIAIQLATGAYHSISGAGADLFALLPFEPTLPELAAALAEKYDTDAASLAADLRPFLEDLKTEEIIIEYSRDSRASKPITLSHSGPRVPYVPPAIQPFRDLQELFLIDPVHDVGPMGWPQLKAEPVPEQECRYRLKGPTSMIFERIDEETVAINLSTGAYHSLSGPAEDIFLLLDEQPTRAEVVRSLRRKYVVAEKEASEAVASFLNSLLLAGLAEQETLEPTPGAAHAIRDLSLAKAGKGLAFVTPALDSFQDQTGVTQLLSETPGSLAVTLTRKRFRIRRPQVIFRQAGPEAVAINFESGNYYRLNSSSAVVFRLLEAQPTASELLSALGQLFEVDRRQLTAVVLILLHNLTNEGLVAAEPAGEGTHELDTSQFTAPRPYEPFSIEAYRELQGLFLPFPGTETHRADAVASGRELVSLLKGYYQEVSQSSGSTETCYRIAGRNVRIRCAAGMRIPELGLAFEHLKSPQGAFEPDLTIQVWDAVSGGPPQHPFLATYLRDFFPQWDKACGTRGEVLAFHSQDLPVLYHAGPDILSVIDPESRTAYYLKRDHTPLPYWEIGSPFRTILHYWLSRQGLQFVHGGAVGGPQGGVILAGKGGSGKSTVSLACLNAGMSYAGDDYCVVELKNPPQLHSLYNTAKLKSKADVDRFPDLRDRVWNPDALSSDTGDKATFFLAQWWPTQMSAGFPLRAVLVPRITRERDTRLGECTEAQALLALAASSVAQLPMAGVDDLDRMGAIVEQLPRYTLYLGTDIAQVPGVIQSLL
jgi:coenzyme PQQ synthesis protein D (PqqD)